MPSTLAMSTALGVERGQSLVVVALDAFAAAPVGAHEAEDMAGQRGARLAALAWIVAHVARLEADAGQQAVPPWRRGPSRSASV